MTSQEFNSIEEHLKQATCSDLKLGDHCSYHSYTCHKCLAHKKLKLLYLKTQSWSSKLNTHKLTLLKTLNLLRKK